MSEEKDQFKVTDRRKFNIDGTPREMADEAEAAPQTEPAPSASAEIDSARQAQPESPEAEDQATGNVVSFPADAARKKESEEAKSADRQAPAKEAASRAPVNQASGAAEKAYNQSNQGRPSSLPQASFLSLLNMLGVEAAMHLGLMESPGSGGSTHVDLDAARHMIDLLGVIEQKTRGNLTADEANLLENMLADLRMHYVAQSRKR